MGVTIYQVARKGDDLYVQVKIFDRSDFALLESLFRDLVAARLCIHTSFGLDERYNTTPVFDYPCRKMLTLVYKDSSGTVGLSPFKKPSTKAAKREDLQVELAEMVRAVGEERGPQLVVEQKGKKNPRLSSRGRTFNTVNRGFQAFLALPYSFLIVSPLVRSASGEQGKGTANFGYLSGVVRAIVQMV